MTKPEPHDLVVIGTGGKDLTVEHAERIALRLKEFELKRRIDHVRNDLERLNPIDDQPQYDTMFVELSKLEGARRRVREQAELA